MGVPDSDESFEWSFDWVGGVGIFSMNVSQYFFPFLALRGKLRIKNSSSPERANPNPTKISVCKAMTPTLMSQMTISQNGIQIIAPHIIPSPAIE